MKRVAAETASECTTTRVNSAPPGRLVDHLLKDSPIVVDAEAPGSQKTSTLPPLALAIGVALGDLVRQREVAFGLSRG